MHVVILIPVVGSESETKIEKVECPCPPALPTNISQFSTYKSSVYRWSKECEIDIRQQGSVLLEHVPGYHPWKLALVEAIGDKCCDNDNGVSEFLKPLEGLFERNLLRNQTRSIGTGIIAFIDNWEKRYKNVQKLGISATKFDGLDLLRTCNLVKEDRSRIKKDLRNLHLIYSVKNVVDSIRRCDYYGALRTDGMELVRLQKAEKRRFGLVWRFLGMIS